jgi:hypothetical protein
MTKIDDGGPAFPEHYLCVGDGKVEAGISDSGMSLRDWFAGQALCATLADTAGVHSDGAAFCKAVAENAYQLADAMLSARKQGGE